MSSIFERFTERARQVVVLAQDEARSLRHNYIGTEHLLLGLMREQEGLANRVLEELEVSPHLMRVWIRERIGVGDDIITGQLPFTPRAKKVLELALREALSLGHNYIGTEHILLGLVREDEGAAADYFAELGITAESVRGEIIRKLSGPGRTVEPRDQITRSIQSIKAGIQQAQRGLNQLEAFLEAQMPQDPDDSST